MIIALGSSPDQSRQINHLLTGRSFGEGQAKAEWLSYPTIATAPGLPDSRGAWARPPRRPDISVRNLERNRALGSEYACAGGAVAPIRVRPRFDLHPCLKSFVV